MQRRAAARIESAIGNNEPFEAGESAGSGVDAIERKSAVIEAFEPYRGKVRKSGTGGYI